MSNRSFLFSDSTNINRKNFSSLYEYLEVRDVEIFFPEKIELPTDAFGDYSFNNDTLDRKTAEISKLSWEEVYELKKFDISLFEIARAELLSFLCVKPEWKAQFYGSSSREIYDLAVKSYPSILIKNIAAASYWLDFWNDTVRKIPRLSYIVVFSGSLIYQKSLIHISKFFEGRTFVLESFFNGTHYYFEEKYEHIANNSDIRFDTVLNSLPLPTKAGDLRFARSQALNLLSNKKNKNVRQPPSNGERVFFGNNPTLLIIGQVLNDFSILDSCDIGISSIMIYEQIIKLVLAETNFNIIFKAHPWENQKSNLKYSVTKDYLSEIFLNQDRVIFVEDYSIVDLFEEADCVLCINSQSGIEAATYGFKPFQLGSAFWGGKGFSNDIDPCGSKLLIDKLLDRSNWRLTLDEYDKFLNWAVKVISWLVPENGGEKRLSQILFEIANSPQKESSNNCAKGKLIANNEALQKMRNSIKRGFSKKILKLIRNPKSFFKDSRYQPFRFFSKFL